MLEPLKIQFDKLEVMGEIGKVERDWDVIKQ